MLSATHIAFYMQLTILEQPVNKALRTMGMISKAKRSIAGSVGITYYHFSSKNPSLNYGLEASLYSDVQVMRCIAYVLQPSNTLEDYMTVRVPVSKVVYYSLV
jgi:hypothetical protein